MADTHMSVEQYSNEVIVVAVSEGPSAFKLWLREEVPTDLASDLQWLCEEYMDSHVVLDLAHQENLEAAFYKLMLDLQGLVEESSYRFVLCGLSTHLQQQMRCVRLSDKFDIFANREAAILELAPQDAY
jgi:anti-anti-sigma regulatory factor